MNPAPIEVLSSRLQAPSTLKEIMQINEENVGVCGSKGGAGSAVSDLFKELT